MSLHPFLSLYFGLRTGTEADQPRPFQSKSSRQETPPLITLQQNMKNFMIKGKQLMSRLETNLLQRKYESDLDLTV